MGTRLNSNNWPLWHLNLDSSVLGETLQACDHPSGKITAMGSHEITFNTNLSETPRTRADFIYKISPTLISITDWVNAR